MNVPSANQVGHTDNKSRPQLVMKRSIRGLGGEASLGGSYVWEYISIHTFTCTYMYICKTTLHCSGLTYTIKYGKLENYNINIVIVHNTTVQYNTISTVHYTGRMQYSIL